MQEFLEGNPEALKNASEKETHEVIDSLPYDKTFEIPREKLLIGNRWYWLTYRFYLHSYR